MIKPYYPKHFFTLLIIGLIFSCSTEEDTSLPMTNVQTEEPEPEPTQYTLAVSAGDGGTVSTEGGTYDEGTSITVSANPDDGYEFVRWEGSDETERELVISINSNITLNAIFRVIITQETNSLDSYYSSGDILSLEPIIFYDRSLTVNGIKIIVAGEIGGQQSVPDKWVYKTAKVFKLLIDRDAEGINVEAQLNMIKTLRGEIGWHQSTPTGQRVAYGGGDEYTPNFLTDQGKKSYEGLEEFEDQLALDDMVWYKNVDSSGTGDDDINEILEHTLHTIHRFGVRGAIAGSTEALNAESDEEDISDTEIYLAMKEAYNNGVFDISGYGEGNINNQDIWGVLLKEYTYLLTFGMWEFNEFWEGGSLAPEWSDKARTPEGILENNPLGYQLYNKYFKPVVSKPSKEILRTIFQDNDQGESDYIPD